MLTTLRNLFNDYVRVNLKDKYIKPDKKDSKIEKKSIKTH